MILPSDGDTDASGEEKKPGDPNGNGNGKKPTPKPGSDAWKDPDPADLPDLSDLFGYDDEAEEVDPAFYSPTTEDWREELYSELFLCIKLLAEIPEPLDEFDPPEPPDLFTFYQELASLKQSLRESQQFSPQMARFAEKISTALAQSNESKKIAELKLRIALLASEAAAAGLAELATKMRDLATPDAP